MAVRRTYCSELSRAAGEQQFGTGSRGTLWLMLEHPGPWGLHPPRDTELPQPAKHYLLNILQVLPSTRVLFIKRERKTDGPLALFVALANEQEPALYSFTLSSYNELLGIDIMSLAAGHHSYEPVAQRPLFLVCTDGKHDYCCARYGFSIYHRMLAYIGETAWQASHVGGDRFAANVVCFPHGLFYGHVRPEDIQPLADGYSGGDIYLPKYRGRACYSFAVQAADYYVRLQAGITRIDALSLDCVTRLDEESWRIGFSSPIEGRIHEVTLRTELSPFSNRLYCKATRSERVPQYRLVDYQLIFRHSTD